MENIYFKGLDKALNDGCQIQVISCLFGGHGVVVERIDKKTKQYSPVLIVEVSNVISALNEASFKFFNELGDKMSNMDSSENTLLDKVLDFGFSLRFYKSSDGQVSSEIFTHDDKDPFNYIPILSIKSNDLKTGFELLNASLECFVDNEQPHNFYNNFYDFVEQQTATVKACQRSLKKDSK